MPIDIRRILVPVDFSEQAGPVLDWVTHLAKQHGSRVLLLHVYHLPVEFQQLEGAYLPPDFWSNVKKEAEQQLARYGEDLRGRGLEVEDDRARGLPGDGDRGRGGQTSRPI